MAQAPNEDLEPRIPADGFRAVSRSGVWLIVSIEYDEPRISCSGSPALLKIGNRASGPTTAENDRVVSNTSCKSRIDSPSPTFENLTVARALDVEHELTVVQTTWAA